METTEEIRVISNEVTLSGGIVAKFGKFKGQHLENITTQGNDYYLELIKAVSEVTTQIGDKKDVGLDDIEGLLSCDFYRLVIAIRNFSAGSELCNIRAEWKDEKGKSFVKHHTVSCALDTFEITESNLFADKEAKNYKIPSAIKVKTSIGEITMNVITVGRQPDLMKMFKGKKTSMMTDLKITQPKSEDGQVLDLGSLDYDVICELFEAKQEAEGAINLDVQIANPTNIEETKAVNIISQPSFFFRWVRK